MNNYQPIQTEVEQWGIQKPSFVFVMSLRGKSCLQLHGYDKSTINLENRMMRENF